jgi:Protein of unknown function (DUF2855)
MIEPSQAFEVRRDTLDETRFVDEAMPEPAAGEVVLSIDAFALTANNITYAVTGDMLGYWRFFPAEDGWGRIPVWGFADVLLSEVDGIGPGDRFYGFLPMAGRLLVQPGRVTELAFADEAAHRADLPAVYNQYLRCAADPAYRKDREAMQMLFRPLFTTGFFLDDFLADHDFFGAGTIVLSSASSKTALALAWLLHGSRGDRIRVVGLTSPGNAAFVGSLGCYDAVVSYDDVATLAKEPAVFVDMAGNALLRAAIHEHYGERLAYSCSVGATHWSQAQLQGGAPLPGPKPELFFAPTQVHKRTQDWGAAGVARRIAAVWGPFVEDAAGWIDVRRSRGPGALEAIYRDVLHNRVDPSAGFILSP